MVFISSFAGLRRAARSHVLKSDNFFNNFNCTFRTSSTFCKSSSEFLQLLEYHPSSRQQRLPPAVPDLFFSEMHQVHWSTHKEILYLNSPSFDFPVGELFLLLLQGSCWQCWISQRGEAPSPYQLYKQTLWFKNRILIHFQQEVDGKFNSHKLSLSYCFWNTLNPCSQFSEFLQ